MSNKISVIICFMVSFFAEGQNIITKFDYPTGEYVAGSNNDALYDYAFESDKYEVYVKAGDNEEQKLQVLISDINYRTMFKGDWMENINQDRTFSFVHIDYNPSNGEKLIFRVIKKYGDSANEVVLAPRSYGYQVSMNGGRECTFEVDDNQKYISVNFNSLDNKTSKHNWIKHMLCVFVDPPETNKPSKSDGGVVVYKDDVSADVLKNASVIYFPKGHHRLKNYNFSSPIDSRGILTIKSGQSVYLEGGAFVEGIIKRTNYGDSNQKVFGRGILSGRSYYWRNHPNYNEPTEIRQMIELGQQAELSGIMYMDSPNHGLTGRDVHVKNVKFLGWHSNHDGIRVGAGSEIEHCFLRAVDDHFYNFNIHVHDCVLWAGHNGAILTYGWGGEQGSNNYQAGSSLLENIDIINPEWTGLGNNNGLVMSQQGYNHPVSDYGTGDATTVLRNIRMEGVIPAITNLKPRSNGDGNTAVQVLENELSYLGDLVLENITVDAQFTKGLIRGEDNPTSDGDSKWLIKDVHFKNITIGGDCVTEANKNDYFTINYSALQNVTFEGCSASSNDSDISDLTLTNDCGKIILNWSGVNNDGYRIRRKMEGESTYMNLEDVSGSTNFYSDETATEGIVYFYMVRPLKGTQAVALSNTPSIMSEGCTEVMLPVNNWVSLQTRDVLSETVMIQTETYDGNYGIDHGDGIVQVNYQIFDINDLNNQLDFFPIKSFPFSWELNTRNYPNGNYQLRSGAVSMDVGETKWTVVDVEIDNTVTSVSGYKHSDQITIFPIPSSDYIHLDVQGEVSSWEIYSSVGHFIERGYGKDILIKSLEAGLFFIQVNDERYYFIKN